MTKVKNVSLFHGNLVQVYHGGPVSVNFQEFDESLPLFPEPPLFYERTKQQQAICRLPKIPLLYWDTPPGGEVAPKSTLEVEVEVDGTRDLWDEVIDLIHSDDSGERGDRFVVETDELGRSLIRFGNGTNGKQLPDGAIVHCTYQIGRGLDGNVGADSLLNFDENSFPHLLACWNPFDVNNGREPELVAEILRRVPQAYRYRQLRAITLQDYENRAAEVPEVSRAAAKYYWTGSWRTVRVAIDPVGTSILEEEVREKVTRHLEAVRLIGEDLEIRSPQFVPLDIEVALCLHPEYWVEDIRFILEQEFSDSYTPDGRTAFFHPDRWTFGQALRVSEIIGAVQGIRGVEHVIEVQLKRWNEVTSGTKDVIEVRANEIILVKNNPDRLEDGFIKFDIKGGRQ
jgi:predicted phage baseplate assembly protein